MVRRPPHARLQRPLAAARLAARAAADAGDRGGRLGRAVRAARPRLVRRRAHAAGARSGSASPARRSCFTAPAAVRASAWRSGSAACWRSSGGDASLAIAVRGPLPAGQPGRGAVPGDGRHRLRAGGRRHRHAPARIDGVCHRGRGPHPARVPVAGLPGGRLGAVPVHRLPADPRFLARLPARAAAARARPALGRRPLRARRAPSRSSCNTPMGGNAVRLGALFGGPVLLCAIWGRPWTGGTRAAIPLVVGFSLLAVWQWSPARPRRDQVHRGPGRQVGLLRAAAGSSSPRCPTSGGSRCPFTRSHWEGDEVAEAAPLARGWLRQLDTGRNPLFYEGRLTEPELRELAGRERGAVRGPAERQARQQLLPGAGADRERPALPAAALALRRLAGVRGHAAGAVRDPARAARTSCSSSSARTSCCSTSSARAARIVRVRWTPYWYAPRRLRRAATRGWTRVIAAGRGLRPASAPASRPSGSCSGAAAATTAS